MIKVAMIGAGSVVFSKNLTSRSPNSAMRRSAYMDVDADRLEVGANLCQRSRNRSAHIQRSRRRRTAAPHELFIRAATEGGRDHVYQARCSTR